jgi:hypothetical protein
LRRFFSFLLLVAPKRLTAMKLQTRKSKIAIARP